ncbi:phosphoribosyl-AMP cyclohydrolase [Clostridium nigeriense]
MIIKLVINNVKSIFLDCDLDTILILVDQVGVTCHTGEKTCMHRSYN